MNLTKVLGYSDNKLGNWSREVGETLISVFNCNNGAGFFKLLNSLQTVTGNYKSIRVIVLTENESFINSIKISKPSFSKLVSVEFNTDLLSIKLPKINNWKLSDDGKKAISEACKLQHSKRKQQNPDYLTNITNFKTRINHEIINDVECKLCSKCKEFVDINRFAKASKNWDGLQSSCNPCEAERKREKRAARKSL